MGGYSDGVKFPSKSGGNRTILTESPGKPVYNLAQAAASTLSYSLLLIQSCIAGPGAFSKMDMLVVVSSVQQGISFISSCCELCSLADLNLCSSVLASNY